ncbi:MAG: nuclear transport factor 2 family protein [Candidatus Acidiferrales bacterium]
MKRTAVVLVCVLMLVCASAQQRQSSTSPKPRTADERVLEGKIRQAWEDIKKKNKAGFAGILSEDLIEVEDGNARDKSAVLAEVDELDLSSYTLGDFHSRSIGSDGMLVRYNVEYAGKAGGESVRNKSAMSEAWEKQKVQWKLAYLQATKIK